MTRPLFILVWQAVVFQPGLCQSVDGEEQMCVGYVNPMIGTAPAATRSALAHGVGTENSAQVIPEVTAPFGMTNWTPQTRHGEVKCVAPYSYSDSLISGFRGSHWLSGSCTQDYGSFTLMPLSGPLQFSPDARASRFSHAAEISTPYYYRTTLERYGIAAELTATRRCGLCRFTFAGDDTVTILLEPNSDRGEGSVRLLPAQREVAGSNPVHRIYQGWGEPAGFSGYFVARFSEPFVSFGTYDSAGGTAGRLEASAGSGAGAFVRCVPGARRTVLVRIGTSFTSLAEARKNLEREAAETGFDTVKNRLRDQWERILSRVHVERGSRAARVRLYTALYHALLQPRLYNDADGSYPSFGGGDSVCRADGGDYYDDFSLWDTYRALHPLYNLLIPEINREMVRSLLLKARQGGWLPTFPCWNSYTAAMIGDHAIAVIADACMKNVVSLTGQDYAYLRKNATQIPADRREYLNGKGVRALESYLRYGFVPLDDSVNDSFHKGEQVSRTLEYAYDDFALSQVAGRLGKTSDSRYFLRRARNYRNVYDTIRSCVCGRFADGTFTREFSKTSRMPYITEGTPWQYTWYVPHDIPGLIALMGGPDRFERNLDAFFAAGQYWHGNEPDQQAPFLYDYCGAPARTQQRVQQILDDEYGDGPGGLCGNDDSGQISAWYVFACLGLYPVCPSTTAYAVCSPQFERIVLTRPGARALVIRAAGTTTGRRFIRKISLNGKPLRGWQIQHADLVGGGTLDFAMQSTPLPVTH